MLLGLRDNMNAEKVLDESKLVIEFLLKERKMKPDEAASVLTVSAFAINEMINQETRKEMTKQMLLNIFNSGGR